MNPALQLQELVRGFNILLVYDSSTHDRQLYSVGPLQVKHVI